MESCSSFFLPRMVGYSNATYLLATGKRYPADSPVLSGIFAELCPEPKDVLPRAIELAEDIISNVSLMAVYLNRQLIWRNPGSAEKAHLVDSPLLYDMFGGKYVCFLLRYSPFAKRLADLCCAVTTSISKKPSFRSRIQNSRMTFGRMLPVGIRGGMSCLCKLTCHRSKSRRASSKQTMIPVHIYVCM